MQTLVVGLDAATWSVIDPLLERDELPNFQSLIDCGARGTLQSTSPPMTPLAWTTLSTGVDPGKHGVYDFLQQDPETYRIEPIDYTRQTRPELWDIFNGCGSDIGVVNYPVVSPPAAVDSFFISGFPGSADEEIAYPHHIAERLASANYRVVPEKDPSDGATAYYDDVLELTETQADTVIDLIDEHDPALCWTVFMGIDWVQHYLWNQTIDGENAVEEFYRAVDSILGRLLDAVDEKTTVLVISDHGACEIESEIHVNSLLEDRGYLTRESDPTAIEGLKSRATDTLWELGTRLPTRVKALLKRGVSEATLMDARAAAGAAQFGMHEQIRWDETIAFSYGYMGRVFVNRTDRYAEGTVTPEEYDDVVNELLELFASLRHPETDEPLVSTAVRGDEVYSGATQERAPDILFEPTEWRHMVYGDFGEEWVHPPDGRVADHHPEGVFIANGQQIEAGAMASPDCDDIAPTILALHGLPILDDMTGDVLTTVFETSFKSDFKPTFISRDEFEGDGASGDRMSGDDDVRDRLESLGYL